MKRLLVIAASLLASPVFAQTVECPTPLVLRFDPPIDCEDGSNVLAACPVSGYRVQISAVSGVWSNLTTTLIAPAANGQPTDYTVARDLAPGTYAFRVYAHNNSVVGKVSTVISCTVPVIAATKGPGAARNLRFVQPAP